MKLKLESEGFIESEKIGPESMQTRPFLVRFTRVFLMERCDSISEACHALVTAACTGDTEAALTVLCGYQRIPAAMALLLKTSATTNLTKFGGSATEPALCGAARCGQVDMIRLLLEHKADINQSNAGDTPPLMLACLSTWTHCIGRGVVAAAWWGCQPTPRMCF
jgi:hypothetical protein